jgi:pyridoxamine 5'-phosphate oxidase
MSANAAEPDPLLLEAFAEFRVLLARATAAGDTEPTAMTLASSDPDGRISARTVLLKELDTRGFVFFTNFSSNKGRQLLAHPRAALLFFWRALKPAQIPPEPPRGSEGQAQFQVEGFVEPVSAAESDAYFATRPRGSQIGAWASLQSSELDARETLLQRVAALEQQYAHQTIPRPPHWGGFRVVPEQMEVWLGREFRLHDRWRYVLREQGVWSKARLYP